MKDLLLEKLAKYGYPYSENGNLITVKLGMSLVMDILIPESGKCILHDRLRSWNFLSGIIEMNIRQAIVFNTIGITLLTVVFIFIEVKTEASGLFFALILAATWIILWAGYFLTKSENFKSQVISWIEHGKDRL